MDGKFEYAWILKLLELGIERYIYMYDTFQGLTKPSKYDYTTKDASIYKMDNNTVIDYWDKQKIANNSKYVNAWCYAPLEKVKNRLGSLGYSENKLHYIVGDVAKTLNDFVPEKIAILRLDTDWYESSKIELEKMYDKVTKGGIIIFDDYYHWDGQRRAVDDFFENIGEKI